MSLKSVSTSIKQAGLHHWPDAPDFVEFLKYPHRHMFGFAVDIEVEDSNREVEFFTLQDHMQSHLKATYPGWRGHTSLLQFGPNSCEMLAEAMCGYLQGLGFKVVGVTVDEDEESSGCYIP